MIPQFAIAIFTTWTTYGTWLPGEERGWFQRGRNWTPDDGKRVQSLLRMNEDAITLSVEQRGLVEKTIDVPRIQFKAWGTRKLDEGVSYLQWDSRLEWWTQRGWDECVDDMESLEQVIAYVRDGQDFQNR